MDRLDEAERKIGSWHLGKTSARHESGGRGADAINHGQGDNGGPSYGMYQLATNPGTLAKYLDQSRFGHHFDGLVPGTREFDAKWREQAKDPEFANEQHEFIRKTHYDVQVRKLESLGIDLADRGRAVQDMLWSTSVQHGGHTHVVRSGLEERHGRGCDVSQLSDREIVEAVQDYKIDHYKELFPGSRKRWGGLLNRAKDEKADLVALSEQEKLLAASGVLPDWRLSVDLPGTKPAFRGVPYVHPGTGDLRLGDRGPAVEDLQRKLAMSGITSADGKELVADGHFGPRTRASVEEFQRRHNLPASGIGDRDTLIRLDAVVSLPDPVGQFERFAKAMHFGSVAEGSVEIAANGAARYLNVESARSNVPPQRVASQVQTTPPPSQVPGASPRAPAAGHASPGPTAISALQEQLNFLGIRDNEGRALAVDGHLGPRSLEAIASFQTAKGLPVTGIPDERTREVVEAYAVVARIEQRKAERTTSFAPTEQAGPGEPALASAVSATASAHSASRLTFLDAGHADHPLFRALRGRLPEEVTDGQVAALTLDAKRNGIRPQRIEEAGVYEGRAYAFGRDAWSGTATVSLTGPAPAIEETMRRSDDFDEQQKQKLASQAQKVAEPAGRVH